MNEFKAIHDDSAQIVALKKRFNKVLEQIRYQLWKKSEKITRLKHRIKKLEQGT